MTSLPTQTDADSPRVHSCDCCGSWTDREATDAQMREEWFWITVPTDDDGTRQWLCPECQ